MKTINSVLIVLLLSLFINSIQAQDYYVKVTPSGSMDGSSWENSMDLHSALAVVESDETIWVAEGEYLPVICNPCSEEEKEISFYVPFGVDLIGGFPNNGDPNLENRDWEKYQTIFSGDIGVNGDKYDNSKTVVTSYYYLKILDGVVIENSYLGPGLSMEHGRMIRNCIFRNNEGPYGAAVKSDFSLTLENCQFYNNHASLKGGAVVVTGDFDQVVHNCIFSNNSCDGDAIWLGGPENLDILNSVFSNNTAVNGGAINLLAYQADYKISNCLFKNNMALEQGHSIFLRSANDITKVSNSIFWDDESATHTTPIVWGGTGSVEIPFELNNNLTNYSDCEHLAGESAFCGEGMIYTDENPFKDIMQNDFSLHDLSLAIDQGENLDNPLEIDLYGNQRIVNGKIDIGAVEYDPNNSSIQNNFIEFEIHPNPCSDFIRIFYDPKWTGIFSLRIYNTIGAIVKDEIFSLDGSFKLYSVSELPTGIYVLSLSNDHFAATSKLVISK